MKRKIKAKWLQFCRWFHRITGGYHQSQHDEIVWKELCISELETSALRLEVMNMEFRHKSLTRMLHQELTE